MAIRLLSNENIDGNLTINGTGTANAPTLAVDTTSSSVFNHAIEAFNGNLTANEGNYIFVGKEGSTKNTGYIGYKYSGTPGSNANILTFGHWASDNLMNLTGDGKLGIGTASPNGKLHISGISQTGTNTAIRIENDTSNTKFIVNSVSGDYNLQFKNAGNTTKVLLNSNGDSYLDGGNVGIGTTSPAAKLNVNSGTVNNIAIFQSSDANANIRVVDINATVQIGNNSGKLILGADLNNQQSDSYISFEIDGGSEKMRIDSSGSVGIGTLSPLTTLDLGTNTGQKFYVYANGSVRSGMGIDLSGSSRELSIFHTSSNNIDGDISFGLRNETSGQYVERMRVQGNGNVGIGTTSPAANLEVIDPVSGNFNGEIRVGGTGSSRRLLLKQDTVLEYLIGASGENALLKFGTGTGATERMRIENTGVMKFANNATSTGDVGTIAHYTNNYMYIRGGTAGLAIGDDGFDSSIYITNNDYINFSTAGSERMRIDSSGQVGIGTVSPVVKLHVAGSAYFSGNDDWNGGGSEGNKTDIALVIDEGDTIYTRDSSQYLRKLIGKYSDIITLGEAGTALIDGISFFSGTSCLYTWHSNTSAVMRLNSTGLGIGTTSPTRKLDIDAGSDYPLSVDSTQRYLMEFARNGTSEWWIAVDGGKFILHENAVADQFEMSGGTGTFRGDVVAYGSPSDKRYKENIKPVTNALDKVSKLQGVTFDWKESESILDIKEDIGFIAQDVQEVLPELVRENEDGKLSLRDKGIVPILVEAIKELKAEIEELKKSK